VSTLNNALIFYKQNNSLSLQ